MRGRTRRGCGAVRLHGRTRLSPPDRAGSGPLQGGETAAGMAGRPAGRRDRPRPVVGDLQRSGARRARAADRHLEPEPQGRRSGVPPIGRNRRRGPRRLFPDRDREPRGAAFAQRRQRLERHRFVILRRWRRRQDRELFQRRCGGELDPRFLGPGPPHGRGQCRDGSGECRRYRQCPAFGAGHARRRLSAVAHRRRAEAAA